MARVLKPKLGFAVAVLFRCRCNSRCEGLLFDLTFGGCGCHGILPLVSRFNIFNRTVAYQRRCGTPLPHVSGGARCLRIGGAVMSRRSEEKIVFPCEMR